jgi:hypothetical protein
MNRENRMPALCKIIFIDFNHFPAIGDCPIEHKKGESKQNIVRLKVVKKSSVPLK